MRQLAMFDRMELWELGDVEKCVKGRGACGYQPCTVAQDVRCCAACMMCGRPCPKANRDVGK